MRRTLLIGGLALALAYPAAGCDDDKSQKPSDDQKEQPQKEQTQKNASDEPSQNPEPVAEATNPEEGDESTSEGPTLPKLASGAEETLDSARHVIVVTTPNWEASSGALTVYERNNDSWKASTGTYAANIGENGFGWGRGLTLPPEESEVPAKKEGDGKSTAGIFGIQAARGYASEAPDGVGISYKSLTERSFCVDDPESDRYNHIVDLEEGASKDWSSAETMRRDDELYSLLLPVQHNGLNGEGEIEAGAGSCIFLHVWEGDGNSTIGCTSIAREALDQVVRKLSSTDETLIVQLPKPVYRKAADEWGLPALQQ